MLGSVRPKEVSNLIHYLKSHDLLSFGILVVFLVSIGMLIKRKSTWYLYGSILWLCNVVKQVWWDRDSIGAGLYGIVFLAWAIRGLIERRRERHRANPESW